LRELLGDGLRASDYPKVLEGHLAGTTVLRY
jgi:hypothetical protein